MDRAGGPMDPGQMELRFDDPAASAGPAADLLKELLRDLEVRFGVILGRRVRVTLRGFDGEFIGLLARVDPFAPADPRTPLRLRIGPVEFDHTDIESCTLLDA